MNLSAWVLSIVGIVVLTLMVDIIIPEGKTGKYIKGVFAMLTVFVIAMPLPKIFNSEFDLEEFLQQNTSASADYDVLDNINIVDIVIDLVSKAAETDKSAVKVYE